MEADCQRHAPGPGRGRWPDRLRGARQRRPRRAPRTRTRTGRPSAAPAGSGGQEYGLDHRRRPLRRCTPIRPRPRDVQGLRPLLGICRRPVERRHFWARQARPDLRPEGGLQEHPRRHEAEPPAVGGPAILRLRQDRPRVEGPDRRPAGHRRQDALRGDAALINPECGSSLPHSTRR